MATRSKPDGGALAGILENSSQVQRRSLAKLVRPPRKVVRQQTQQLTEMVNGYDFADVVLAYWRGYEEGNEQLKADAVRWMRGEFSTRTDARAALNVRNILDDSAVYDQLKLLALRSPGWLQRATGLPGRVGESVQVGQHAGAECQLRTDTPYSQRLVAGLRRRFGMRSGRHA